MHDGHFDVVEGGTAVRFRSHLNGATTGGSSYPRTELREMKPGNPKEEADWEIKKSDGTVRRLTARVKVTQAPSTKDHNRVSIGQIHDAKDDLLQIMYDGKKKAVGYTWPVDGEGTWQPELLVTDYPPATAGSPTASRSTKDTVRILIDDGQGFQEKARKTGVAKKAATSRPARTPSPV